MSVRKFKQCVFRWQSLERVTPRSKRTRVSWYRCHNVTDHASGLCPKHQILRDAVKDCVEGIAALVDFGGLL